MPEFDALDFERWLRLSIEKNCSLSKAIHYDLFWKAHINDKILTKAMDFAQCRIDKLIGQEKRK